MRTRAIPSEQRLADGFWGSRFERAFFDVNGTRTHPQTGNPNSPQPTARGLMTKESELDLGVRLRSALQHHHGMDQLQAVLLSPSLGGPDQAKGTPPDSPPST